jgi:hypothetical protein
MRCVMELSSPRFGASHTWLWRRTA